MKKLTNRFLWIGAGVVAVASVALLIAYRILN